MLSRDEAYKLLIEYNKNDALIKHALAVEGVMRYFASLYNEDIEYWGVIGLLHDLDYEMYPDEHCTRTAEILREHNIDEQIIRAIVSHGYGICSDVKPELLMEKILFTIDELTGLINATAIMRPSKSIMDLELKSLKKKFKTPSFAAKVDRSVIERGTDMLGMDLDCIMQETINGMKLVATEIGLGGVI